MIIITIRLKKIESSLKKVFSELKGFHKDEAGGFYVDEIMSKNDDTISVDMAIKEATDLIEKYSELFMKVYQTGGETELYIMYRQKDGFPFKFSTETLSFMSHNTKLKRRCGS